MNVVVLPMRLGDVVPSQVHRSCRSSRVSSINTMRSAVLASSASSALVLVYCHDAGGDVVIQREHGDGGFADREGRSCDHRRQKAFEPLACLGQFGGNARAS